DVRGRDDQLVAVEIVVRLGVGHGRAEHLLDLPRGGARSEREHGPRLRNRAAPDVLGHEPRLAGRHAHPAGDGLDLLALGGSHQVLLTSALRSPEWPRKVRVGANSPSLWPTICSVTNTGTCLRPSWTAIVCPTISGKTVEVLDQVRTICFEPDEFISSIRLKRRSSTNGPFFEDLLIASLCL